MTEVKLNSQTALPPDLRSHLPQVVFLSRTGTFCVLKLLLITCIVQGDQAVVGGCLLPVKGRLVLSIQTLLFFCLGTGDALKHISFTASSDLPAGPVVSCDWYPICHVWDELPWGEICTLLMTV